MTSPTQGEHAQPAELPEDIAAIVACLGDDAASLRDENPEDERADNMDAAARLIEQQYASLPPAQPVAQQGAAPKFYLSVNQLLQALEFATGGTPESADDLETSIGFQIGDSQDDDGKVVHGMRCWLADYPDEGVYPLDEEPTEKDLAALALRTQQPAPVGAVADALQETLDRLDSKELAAWVDRGMALAENFALYVQADCTLRAGQARDILRGHLFSAQPSPTPQADSDQGEFISREERVERAMRVYLIAGDTEDEARECAEYQWGELDMDDIPDPYFTAMEDIEGRGPAPQADSVLEDAQRLEPVADVVPSTLRGADVAWRGGHPMPVGTVLFAARKQGGANG